LAKFDIVKLQRRGREVKPMLDKEVLILPLIELKPKAIECLSRTGIGL
jgi:hypothetical protein